MKNLFSSPPDLQKLFQIFLKEQRAQRADLQEIKRMINRLTIDANLQNTVDKYFEDTEHIPEEKYDTGYSDSDSNKNLQSSQ